jgi:phosphoenolpyruvate synthase/pyruvate phosphate dikinase
MKWFKALKRDHHILSMCVSTEGYRTSVKKVLGSGITSRMIFYDGKIFQQYDSEVDIILLTEFFKKNLNPKLAHTITKRLRLYLDRLKQFSDNLETKDFAIMPNRRLRSLFLGYCSRLSDCLPQIVVPRYFDYAFTDYLKAQLAGAANIQEAYNALVSPDYITALGREQIELLKLALKEKTGKKEIQEHARKFHWLPCHFMYQGPPYTESYFASKLLELRKMPKAHLNKKLDELLANKQGQQQARNQILTKYRLNPKSRFLFDFSRELSAIKATASDVWTRTSIQVYPLLNEIASKLGINFREMCYLTPWEVAALLDGKKLPVGKIVSMRKEYCLIIFEKGAVIQVYSGSTAQEKFRMKDIEKAGKQTELKGLPTYPGIARGRARIIFSRSEASKLKKGEILITSMTLPGLTNAISKAAAIATDEGGATCHAAIISREFKKPCVVGTKHATSIIMTGDIVEVDANKGIVRKIKA